MADPTTGASASSEPKLEPKLTEMATNPVGTGEVTEKKDVEEPKKEESTTEATVCCDYFLDVTLMANVSAGSRLRGDEARGYDV
jgi:hypothetical protein